MTVPTRLRREYSPWPAEFESSGWWDDFPADEQVLLGRADAWSAYPSLSELSHNALQQLTQKEGMDFAVAVLYTRLLREPQNAALYAKVREARKRPPAVYPRPVTLAFCPGAYYREITKNGADGRILREAAEPYVQQAILVPTGSSATAAENGAFLCEWLLERPSGERIVFASLSKGASDIKAALAHPMAETAFRNVRGWINVSGVLCGLPIFNWLLRRPVMTAAYRFLFWCRGMDFRVIPNLRWGEGEALDFPLWLPDHVRMLTVVGFPLGRHFGHPLLRKNRRRMAPWGPNDGLMLLGDSCLLPGAVYPVWGADHFMRPRGDSRPLAALLAGILVEELADHVCTLS
jgi:hypothetical protein